MTTFDSAKETEALFGQAARALNLTDDSYAIVKSALRQAFVTGIDWQIDQEIVELDKELKELDKKLDEKIAQFWANC